VQFNHTKIRLRTDGRLNFIKRVMLAVSELGDGYGRKFECYGPWTTPHPAGVSIVQGLCNRYIHIISKLNGTQC
jgi:hypothetical protein